MLLHKTQESVDFIKETESHVLFKQHLKLVFDTYYSLFGEVCQSCPSKIQGYIKRIKNFKSSNIMAKETKETKSEFILKKGTIIPKGYKGKPISEHNITDEIAASLLKANPNRKVLFSKIPEGFLAEDSSTEKIEEKPLSKMTVKELREAYPEAKGKSKADLLKSVNDLIAAKQINVSGAEEEE